MLSRWFCFQPTHRQGGSLLSKRQTRYQKMAKVEIRPCRKSPLGGQWGATGCWSASAEAKDFRHPHWRASRQWHPTRVFRQSLEVLGVFRPYPDLLTSDAHHAHPATGRDQAGLREAVEAVTLDQAGAHGV